VLVPELSVMATTGNTVSPPPVGLTMVNATGALPTTCPSAVRTVAVRVTVFSVSPMVGATTYALA